MPKIKFSHQYTKFPPGFEQSKLIDVIPVNLEDLSADFLSYDTHYLNVKKSGLDDYYHLPKKGEYMILMLFSWKGRLWTTIRSQRGMNGLDKLAYYRSHIGEVFDCEVIKEPKE